jgi:hypothetical protein
MSPVPLLTLLWLGTSLLLNAEHMDKYMDAAFAAVQPQLRRLAVEHFGRLLVACPEGSMQGRLVQHEVPLRLVERLQVSMWCVDALALPFMSFEGNLCCPYLNIMAGCHVAVFVTLLHLIKHLQSR